MAEVDGYWGKGYYGEGYWGEGYWGEYGAPAAPVIPGIIPSGVGKLRRRRWLLWWKFRKFLEAELAE